MGMTRTLLLVAVGFVAGVFAAITGGNSLLTVPVMMLAGMDAASAVATNMVVLASLSLGAVVRFLRSRVVPFHPTAGLILVSVPGSILGAFIAVWMSELVLRTIIAVAIVGMGFLLAFQPQLGAAKRERSPRTRLLGYVAMAAWGVYGGMFSGGYATVLTLACVAFFGVRLLEGIAVTKVVNFAGSFAATLVFFAEGRVQWSVGVPMSLAAMLGGWLGAHLALRWGPQPVRRLLFVVVTGLGAKLVYDAERAWVPRHGSGTPDK
jgi:uncharacterized membrane protein YfcA